MNDALRVADDADSRVQAALARGDRDTAIDVLMQSYGRSVYRYCLYMVADAETADDVHQMTFLQAFEALESFDGRSSWRTWLHAIARHRCLDALRARRRRQKRFEPLDAVGETADGANESHRTIRAHDVGRALADCLGELAPQAREAVLLRHQMGFSYAEMEDLCRAGAAALRVRVARALPVLQRCLERKGIHA